MLLESLASLVLLSIMLVAVTMMIRSALVVTTNAIWDARRAQDAYNRVIARGAAETTTSDTFTLTSESTVYRFDVPMPVSIITVTENGRTFTGFFPPPTNG